MKYLEAKKRAFLSIVNKIKGFIRKVSGASPLILPDCVDEDSLINYTISGNSIQSILPKGYQSVEYIESSGTQYIDTEVIANQNTGFEIEFLTKSIIGMSGYGSIFGARLGSTVKEFHLTTYGSTNTQGTFRFETKSTNGGIQAEGKSKISLKNGIYITSDGDEIALADVNFETPCSITIFALNQNSTITQYSKTRLFSFKLYDGDVLLRDFIPCCRLIDNVVGLYDLVNDKFYFNKGTGSFLKGSDVPATPTPEEPIEVEFVGDETENLFRYPHVSTTKTTNGVSFTDNGDGTVTVNGTATANASYGLLNMTNITDNTKKYFVTGCPSASNATKCILVGIYSEGAWKSEKYEVGSGLLIDLSSFDYNIDRLSFNILISKGQTVDNWTFKPMLVEGDAPKEFEPYNKYKIPIKVSGKNLYNPTKTNLVQNGVTFTRNADNTFTVNGTATANAYFHIGDKFVVDPIKKYYLSGGTEKLKLGVQLFGENVTTQLTTISINKGLIELPTSVGGVPVKYFNVVLNVKSGDVCENEIMKPMLSHIETDEFEPYVEPIATNIYLDEPLKSGENISYPKNDIPKLPTFKGTTIYSVDTKIPPSNMNVTYYSSMKGE